ncbi:SixA phosphatase family protein [Ilumatobacter nonamiensis]|uniref:SixA phosphatase family protein n=1 Tax=Ilumatobacter nonamiensis TaxID=467093 RepID=UPI00034DFBCB|nr:phosphoglycerate mutase family protein [Ilumatobacter nonamiensis]
MGQVDTIYLVRHAKAGERRLWTGDDTDRPLSKKGWKQSAAVAKRLSGKHTTGLYSSAYVRCVQTLEPLAELTGEKVRIEPRLFEDEPFEPVLDLLVEVENGAVLCSHGDIIPATIQALHRRGMTVETPVDWGKSSIWVLRRKGEKITKGKVWPAKI